jgi:hypothetical protein
VSERKKDERSAPTEPKDPASLPPPAGRSSKRPRQMSDESTGPFELARVRSPSGEQKRISSVPPPPVAAAAPKLKFARRAAVLAMLNTIAYLGVAALGVVRYRADPDAIFEIVLSILALGLAAWGASTSRHLFHASRAGAQAGHSLAAAFSSARSAFILKGTGLFLVLAISCFAFSAILSVFAFL